MKIFCQNLKRVDVFGYDLGTGQKPEGGIQSVSDGDLQKVSVNYHWILRNHLLLRIYFFSLKQLLDTEIKANLPFKDEEGMFKYFSMIGYFIQTQYL